MGDDLAWGDDLFRDTGGSWHLTIAVNLKSSQGELVTESFVFEAVSVVVELQPAPGASTSQEAVIAVRDKSETEPSKWSCQLEKAGRYQVHVKFDSFELNGSPYDANFQQMQLDSTHCERTLVLSSDLTKVSTSGSQEQRSVYMTPINSGVHKLRVKFIRGASHKFACFLNT